MARAATTISIDAGTKPFLRASQLASSWNPSSFPILYLSISCPLSISISKKPQFQYCRSSRVNTVVEEGPPAVIIEEEVGENRGGLFEEAKAREFRPFELYVCNIPRSCNVSQLLDLFIPYGAVFAVEISRDFETGRTRGCGYVGMCSFEEAKAAIEALDGTDLGGREMRVKFSYDMVFGRTSIEASRATPKKSMIYETTHKAYVGNLAWSVRPEDLREHFSQFGTVISTKLLYDRKQGGKRAYGFISFSSSDALQAALETNGSKFHGRTLLVKEAVERD